MTPTRLAACLAILVGVEAGVFAWWNWDLVYLSQPRAGLVQSAGTRFQSSAVQALSRPRLARRHLETIADVSARRGEGDLHLRALRRLAAEYPAEASALARLGDALRLAGRYEEAEAVYRRLLPGGRR